MLQINGLDDNKSEWNLNETHILVPMIDGDVKNTDKNTLTLETGDQTVLTNTLEHNLIIGIDKNIFESSNFKNDFVIIHNSDLKNSLGYTLCLDQEKNEIFWQSPSSLKDNKIYASDKGLFEVKDILNFNTSGQESDKIDQQIGLSGLESNSKDVEIFIESDNKCEEKSLLVNYVSNIDNYQSINNSPENTQFFEQKKNKNDDDEKIKHKKLKKNNCDGINDIITQIKTKDDLNSLPEKSLPLKKKAKMKRTLICTENQRSVIKNINSYNKDSNMTSAPKTKQINQPKDTESLKLTQKILRSNLKKPKWSVNANQTKNITETKNNLVKDLCSNQDDKFNNIFELIENLRRSQIINSAVWQILHAGLKEMSIDILQEMNKNMNNNCSQKSSNYSPQLKAFALVLYFKQPAAFNHLAQTYKSGWPSLNVIKEWKKQMNNQLKSVETDGYETK